MPDQNNNRRPDQSGGPKRKNTMMLLSLVLWALAITVFVNYASSMYRQTNSVEIDYGTFRQMVVDDKVARVVMASDKFVIYPKIDEKGVYAAPDVAPSGPLSVPSQDNLPPIGTEEVT